MPEARMDDQRTDRKDGGMTDTRLHLLREFAEQLGWRGLEVSQIRLTTDICGSYPVGTVITSYHTTDLKFNLQINENPIGQIRHHQASIVAERYGIRPIPWQPFTVDDRNSAIAEALRLSHVLSRSILRNPASRRQFVRQHSHLVYRRFVGRRMYKKLTGKK
jgi:hypothetical protein